MRKEYVFKYVNVDHSNCLVTKKVVSFENIEDLPQRFEVMSADVEKMKAFIAHHTGL